MKPIEEQITENLTQSLEGIRINAGDNFNASAEEGEAQGNSALAASLTLRSDSTSLMPGISSLGRDHYVKRYTIEAPVSVSDDSAADSDERAASRLAADIVKAVMDDYQRGALALNTKIIKLDYGQLVGDRYGAVVTLEVHFWTLKDDPFNQ